MTKKILFIFIFSILSIAAVWGQDMPRGYYQFIREADSLYMLKEYDKSAHKYSDAFKSNFWRGSIVDRYHAACSWALSSVPDSAFYQLNQILEKSTLLKYEDLVFEECLGSLHKDNRWNEIVEITKKRKEVEEKDYNKLLIAQLDTIFIDDQKYRKQIDSIEQKWGVDSKEIDDHWKIISKMDSINQVKVKLIIDKYGWLGPDVITDQGNVTLFLVIQHSNLQTQLNYLPILKEAVKIGNANGADLALLEDRVNLGLGKK